MPNYEILEKINTIKSKVAQVQEDIENMRRLRKIS